MATQSSPGAFWEDRDKTSTPFVTFMIIVLQHQIHHGKSDPEMSFELGIDPKTYREWRSSIPFPDVIAGLLNKLNARYITSGLPAAMVKLRSQLVAQLRPISRTVIPAHRSHTGLPTEIAFNNALDHCLKSVMRPWAAKEFEKHGKPSKVAQEVANGLKWSYAYSPVRNIATSRELLTKKAIELASISAELALLKEVSQPDFARVPDVQVSQRQRVLEAQIPLQLNAAQLAAEHYVTAIESVAIDEDQWSEKSTAKYPNISGPASDPEAKAKHISRIHCILDSFVKISGDR
jgi:hypothetical protein